MDSDIRSIGHSTKCLLLFWCDLFPICIVFGPCVGVEVLPSPTERQQKGPGTPGVEGQHRANRAMHQEGGTQLSFCPGNHSRGSVLTLLLPLNATEEGCDNKNTS